MLKGIGSESILGAKPGVRGGVPTVLLVEGAWTARERSMLICELELLVSTIGLVTLAPLAQLNHVYSFTDNTVAMAAMRVAAGDRSGGVGGAGDEQVQLVG